MWRWFRLRRKIRKRRTRKKRKGRRRNQKRKKGDEIGKRALWPCRCSSVTSAVSTPESGICSGALPGTRHRCSAMRILMHAPSCEFPAGWQLLNGGF
uniref:Uncharacterized protein n=1 Tax=Kalanchoe fedtschenkoi TaxID=63787 RepID=A0A7N0TTI9_KALFE